MRFMWRGSLGGSPTKEGVLARMFAISTARSHRSHAAGLVGQKRQVERLHDGELFTAVWAVRAA